MRAGFRLDFGDNPGVVGPDLFEGRSKGSGVAQDLAQLQMLGLGHGFLLRRMAKQVMG